MTILHGANLKVCINFFAESILALITRLAHASRRIISFTIQLTPITISNKTKIRALPIIANIYNARVRPAYIFYIAIP